MHGEHPRHGVVWLFFLPVLAIAERWLPSFSPPPIVGPDVVPVPPWAAAAGDEVTSELTS